MKNAFGSRTIARPKATLWRSPPESPPHFTEPVEGVVLVSLSSIPTDRETEIVGNLRHRKLWLWPVVLLALVATACGGGATTIDVEELTDDVVEDVAEDAPEPTNEPEETPTADIEPEAVLDPVCGISKGDGPFEQVACDQPHGGELAAVIESNRPR